MPIFEHVSHYPHPRAEVFAWHTRPGGFVRLTPPGMATVIEGPTDLINPGSEVLLKISHPLVPGLVPRPLAKVGVTWRVRHVELDDGRLFVDEQVSGPFRRWRHEHHFSDAPDGGTTITDRVDWELPPMPTGIDEMVASHELRRLFAFREHQLRHDLALHARLAASPTTVLVSGASGLIGSQVCALLTTGGHTVRTLVRRETRSTGEARWSPRHGSIDQGAVDRAGAVVHLAGESIGGRFTEAKKRRILESRVDGTRTIAAAIARSGRRQVLAQASAIGVYGARRPGELLTEQSSPGTGFLADVVRAWEDAAREADGRTVLLRTGIVLSEGGGALAPMLPLFLAGVGGPLTNSRAWMSWISLDDMARSYLHALFTPDLSGPVNAVAPEPVTAGEFARTLGRTVRRPALVPTPGFGPALVLGAEGKDQLIDTDQRVDAGLLLESGFRFGEPTLREALRHVLRHDERG